MLAEVGIEDAARRLRQYPHQMSGGMLQRVMIAAALLTGPRLLLADEPTTALDVTTQAEVMAILDDLRRESGLAMLFITHDLELAAAICDRTAVMYAGQIVEVRASALLHSDPLHPYTAALAAARPDITQAAHRLRAIPGRRCPRSRRPPGRAPSRRDVRTRRTSAGAAMPASPNSTRRARRCARAPSCAASSRWRPMPDGAARRSWRQPGCARSSASSSPSTMSPSSFRAGRSLAIVGRVRSGKTTIARMIVGLERPTRGTITACGRDRSRPPRSARDRRRRGREVQIVFQDPYTSLDPRQNAEAAIDEVLRLHHGWPASAAAPGSPNSPAWSASTNGSPRAAPVAVRRPAAAGGDRPRPRSASPPC